MKVVQNIPHRFESRGFGGVVPIFLEFTLVLMDGDSKCESAQLIICDRDNNF